MQKKIFRVLPMSAVISLCLALGVTTAPGQCGADGTKPCSSATKTPQKKNISSRTKSKTKSQTTIVQGKASSKSVKSSKIKTISSGVVNGKAVNLVKPPYPAAARAVRASGTVEVQVTIDEEGNVITAEALSGHPLLQASAVEAARASKFSPTLLDGQPVRVTGVIVYNFQP